MIAPTLLIGLGGTGSKIVARVSQKVTEEQRKHIGFAVFDTDINELREIQQVNPFVHIIQTSTRLTVGQYLDKDTYARDNWFPVHGILNSKALTEGAGQVRSISRLALDTAIKAGNMEPLHKAVEQLYRLEGDKGEQALRVIIVSSLAGGTGSGLILPVALYLKNYLTVKFQQGANITRGFFILPEVFYEVIRGESERNNLRCNAYATLRELDAFLMKGDKTLPEKYLDKVKIEFPRVGSNEREEYDVRPYDFCFLFDAQNIDGKKLNNFNQYLDHAANCIYSQSIGPMNKRSNSSEDNTIRELCEQSGRNRYAGAGSAMLIYPFEDVKKYLGLNWAKECVSEQWLVFDEQYKEKLSVNAEARAEGLNPKDVEASVDYIQTVEQLARQKDPFAKAITTQCTIFDEDGFRELGKKWNEYVKNLEDFVRQSVKDQNDLNSQKEIAESALADVEIENKIKFVGGLLKGAKEISSDLVDAFIEAQKYKGMVEKYSEESSRSISFSIFKTKNTSVKDKLKHQMETYLYDEEGNFMHPNAIRYFLYQTLELLKEEKRKTSKKLYDLNDYYDVEAKLIFDDPKTPEEVETDDEFAQKKHKITELEDTRTKIRYYIEQTDEYRHISVLEEVLNEGVEYTKKLCKSFEDFYTSFGGKVKELNRDIVALHKKYGNTSGRTTRYVCASPKCMESLLKEMPYKGTSIALDSELSQRIYIKVREYSMLKEIPEDGGYFDELFEDGIVKYFEDSVVQAYGNRVNMDIISALEKEAVYMDGLYDTKEIEQYVIRTIEQARNLSNPFIERPLGEQKEPISACTYNNHLDPKDDSARSALIEKYLGNFGGTPDEDIPLNMIMFYQSIYGLRANGLSKFAPGSKEINRTDGEYYKAYYELVSKIKPKTNKTAVITPHLDKNWHLVINMPDLDEENQKKQERNIYRAFILGILLEAIKYKKVSNNKYLYKLQLPNIESEDFVVSNKTPCDNFYEVLDAITINPVVVNQLLKYAQKKFYKEKNGNGKLVFENSILKKGIDKLGNDEFERKNMSIFEIPLLLKISTPATDFEKQTGIDVMKEILNTIFDYMKSFMVGGDLDTLFGDIVIEQALLFQTHINWYIDNYADNFSDYIDDLLNVANTIADEKELDSVCDKIHEIRDGIK